MYHDANTDNMTIYNVIAMSRYSKSDAVIVEQQYTILDNTENLNDFSDEINHISGRSAVALYSGGLDITATACKYKNSNMKVKITEIYFDWGSNASEWEIKAGHSAEKNGIIDKFIVIDIKNIMSSIFGIVGVTNVRLMDKTAKGAGEKEAESSLSYVPYRNTFFLTLAASWIENNLPDSKVDLLIGGNLTEAMGGYSDGSNAYLDVVEKTLRLGGNNPMRLRIYAPFVNKTKTWEFAKEIKIIAKPFSWF